MTTAVTRPLGMFTLLGAASSIHDFVESRLSSVGLSIPRLAALQRQRRAREQSRQQDDGERSPADRVQLLDDVVTVTRPRGEGEAEFGRHACHRHRAKPPRKRLSG